MIQVVIVPILGKTDEEKQLVDDAVAASRKALQAAGVRCSVDDRDWIRPGAKYFEWEKKGVPLRLEVGPRDVQNGVAMAKPRVWSSDGGGSGKVELPLDPSELASACVAQLDAIQNGLLSAAQARLAAGTRRISSYLELKEALARADAANPASRGGTDGGESGGSSSVEHLGFFLAPWKCNADNEDAIKQETRATVRCYPLEGQEEAEGKACFYSGEPATHMAIFARAF